MKLGLILSILVFGVYAFAQVASPGPSVVPVQVVAVVAPLGFVGFLVKYGALIAAALVAIMDLLFALNPGVEANGIAHAAYLWLKGFSKKDQA